MEKEIITAVEAIKTAILNSQYEAAKDVNRVQLVLYFGIGRFLSSKKGKKTWGSSVLETISSQLQKELPGLRGFSAESLKKMRQFYESWSFLEGSNSATETTGFISDKASSVATGETSESNSVIAITDLKLSGVSLKDFPAEDFFKVPFTHHITIFTKVKNLKERYYFAEYIIQDYDKPMGISTYKSLSEMPEKLQKVMPDIEELKKLL